MKYALGNMLNGAGGFNPDGLSLDLQFAADKTLTARKGPTPVFTRASSATQVGASGLIEYAPENLALQSENFGTTWSNTTGNALTLNDALSPTGTLTADRIDFPATAAAGLVRSLTQNFGSTVAGNGAVTASVWLRTVSGTSTVYLTLLDGGPPWQRVHVACNVTTEWTRFSVTLDTPAISLFLLIGPDTRTTNGTPVQPAVQDAASVYAWGAQLERFSSARAYIPTTTAAIYGARFDHDPVTLACKGLLIEESRTNNCYNSNLLTTASWLAAATTVASDDAGPDGTTAYEISETTASAVHAFVNSGSNTSTPLTVITSGVAYTQSVFLKKSVGSVDWIQLTFTGGSFVAGQFANFNLSTGTVGNLSGVTSRIEKFPNEWYRCSITATATSATSNGNAVIVQFTNNTNTTVRGLSYSGSTSNKILVAMGQLEAGSFPTSYIPTTTASLARSADVCSITGGDFTGMYNATEGSVISQGSIENLVGNNRGMWGINNNTGSHGFLTLYGASGGGIVSQSRNTAATALPPTFANSASTSFKRGLTYYSGGASISTNGTTATDTVVTNSTQTMLTLQIGNMLAGAFYWSGHIASIRYFKKRLSNQKLQTLTT